MGAKKGSFSTPQIYRHCATSTPVVDTRLEQSRDPLTRYKKPWGKGETDLDLHPEMSGSFLTAERVYHSAG